MITSATSTTAVSVRDLRKNYGAVEATRGVNFDIYPGEIVGLVGDNGAGKSTVTKMIAGDVAATSGEIRIGGSLVQSSSTTWARDHGVEMVYQDLALCDNLDICANIFLGREITRRSVVGLHKLNHDAMMAKAQNLLTMLNVKLPSLREPVTALSGGQRQMVAIARSVAYEPKLVIMDEPTAALSVSAGQPVLDLIRRLPQSNVAILLISHRLSDVLSTADRILVLRQGKVVATVHSSEVDEGQLLHLMAGIGAANED
jgi:ABC-type sugar transport system ATPase subunit